MSPADLDKTFKDAFPKAVDFPAYEHDSMAAEIAEIAKGRGYRFAGYRLARAVFSTKPQK